MAYIQIVGFVFSCVGWVGIVVATCTNDWVTLCKNSWNACQWMETMGSQGPWADCPISSRLYQCFTLNKILDLPAYIQATRALMIIGSILGLPAVALLLMSMPCIKQREGRKSTKNKRVVLGGILMLIVAVCGLVSTLWFPIGSNQEHPLMSFNFSLYIGWAGTILCLLGGSMLTCCSSQASPDSYRDDSRYFSKQGGGTSPPGPPSNHATSTHV